MPNNPASRRVGSPQIADANAVVRRSGLPVNSPVPQSSAPETAGQPSTITETSGPTVLTVGAIADHQVLIRDGTTVTGVTGITATIATAKLTALGANGSMTFSNGILTAQSPAT